MYNLGLRQTQSRYVVMHDNNNQNVYPGWIGNLTYAMRHTNPQPVILSTNIEGVSRGGHEEEHHPVMDVELFQGSLSGDEGTVLLWRDGRGKALQAPPGMEVVAGDVIESHSYMADLGRIGVRDFLSPDMSWASYHVNLALAVQRRFGFGAAAVLRTVKYSYMYPDTHGVAHDVPLTLVRWNSHDCTSSIAHLEKLYRVRYFSECGFLFHSTMFLARSPAFINDRGPGNRITLGAMLLGMYANLHFRTLVLHTKDPNTGYAETLPPMYLRTAMQWLSDHNREVEAGMSITVTAYKEVGFNMDSINIPNAVIEGHATWLRDHFRNQQLPISELEQRKDLSWHHQGALLAVRTPDIESACLRPRSLIILKGPALHQAAFEAIADDAVVVCDKDHCHLLFYLFREVEQPRLLVSALSRAITFLPRVTVTVCSALDRCEGLPVVTPSLRVVRWKLDPNAYHTASDTAHFRRLKALRSAILNAQARRPRAFWK